LIGLGSGAGLAVLVWFNNAVYGSTSVAGGYGAAFNERAASFDVLDYLGNIALALVDLDRGLLVFSPFLILLIPGLRAGWRAAPAWVRGSAVGGLLYLLLQLKANRYSGGEGFWGYRYPLETLVAAAPLLLLSYTEWVRQQTALWQKLFRWLLVASIALTAAGSVAY
jgi:alpha-1,2-mannosyltransferase